PSLTVVRMKDVQTKIKLSQEEEGDNKCGCFEVSGDRVRCKFEEIECPKALPKPCINTTAVD
ncbi:5763_t:CDS:1, partial [Cetraspora pellucida]